MLFQGTIIFNSLYVFREHLRHAYAAYALGNEIDAVSLCSPK